MSYLYSKLPETGVSPHIGTGGTGPLRWRIGAVPCSRVDQTESLTALRKRSAECDRHAAAQRRPPTAEDQPHGP
jgi:hypothetical protein